MQLPDSAQEIADVIGRDAALYLIGQLPKVYGGSAKAGKQNMRCVMYVPKRLMPSDILVRILGWEAACKLAYVFSGMVIHPANCKEVYRPHRDANIARLVSEGVAVKIVAEWFDVSERTVKNIAAEIPPLETEHAANDNCAIPSKRTARK